MLHVVGRGGFGKVMQVRKKDDGEIFAIKVRKPRIERFCRRPPAHPAPAPPLSTVHWRRRRRRRRRLLIEH